MTHRNRLTQWLLLTAVCICGLLALRADQPDNAPTEDTEATAEEPSEETEKVPAEATTEKEPAPTSADESNQTSGSWTDKVVIVPIEGLIAESMVGGFHDDFKKAFKRIKQEKPRLVILEVDSLGGYVNVCDDMCERIIKCPVPVKALVLRRAISGGAMVSTSCKEIYMLQGSRIGDIQPMHYNSDGTVVQMDARTEEKTETDVRAIMRSNANTNGYPARLLDAMVSRSYQIYEVNFSNGDREFLSKDEFDLLEKNMSNGHDSRNFSKKPKLVVTTGKLLTLTATEAHDYGIAKEIYKTRSAFFKAQGIDESTVIFASVKKGGAMVQAEKFRKELTESLANMEMDAWMIVLLGLCLIVGIAGTLTEMNAPGFGIPGACGIIGFACFFTILFWHGGGRANIFELVLFLVGIILLVVEIVILPGFGVAGILGGVFLLGGLILMLIPDFDSPAMSGDWLGQIGFACSFILVTVGIGSLLFFLIISYGQKIPGMNRLFLQTNLQDGRASLNIGRQTQATDAQYNPDPREKYLSMRGIALTQLRPSGKVKLENGEHIDVVTRGNLIEVQAAVIVAEVSMNRIVVDEAPEADSSTKG